MPCSLSPVPDLARTYCVAASEKPQEFFLSIAVEALTRLICLRPGAVLKNERRRWVDYFVLHKSVSSEKITKALP